MKKIKLILSSSFAGVAGLTITMPVIKTEDIRKNTQMNKISNISDVWKNITFNQKTLEQKLVEFSKKNPEFQNKIITAIKISIDANGNINVNKLNNLSIKELEFIKALNFQRLMNNSLLKMINNYPKNHSQNRISQHHMLMIGRDLYTGQDIFQEDTCTSKFQTENGTKNYLQFRWWENYEDNEWLKTHVNYNTVEDRLVHGNPNIPLSEKFNVVTTFWGEDYKLISEGIGWDAKPSWERPDNNSDDHRIINLSECVMYDMYLSAHVNNSDAVSGTQSFKDWTSEQEKIYSEQIKEISEKVNLIKEKLYSVEDINIEDINKTTAWIDEWIEILYQQIRDSNSILFQLYINTYEKNGLYNNKSEVIKKNRNQITKLQELKTQLKWIKNELSKVPSSEELKKLFDLFLTYSQIENDLETLDRDSVKINSISMPIDPIKEMILNPFDNFLSNELLSDFEIFLKNPWINGSVKGFADQILHTKRYNPAYKSLFYSLIFKNQNDLTSLGKKIQELIIKPISTEAKKNLFKEKINYVKNEIKKLLSHINSWEDLSSSKKVLEIVNLVYQDTKDSADTLLSYLNNFITVYFPDFNNISNGIAKIVSIINIVSNTVDISKQLGNENLTFEQLYKTGQISGNVIRFIYKSSSPNEETASLSNNKINLVDLLGKFSSLVNNQKLPFSIMYFINNLNHNSNNSPHHPYNFSFLRDNVLWIFQYKQPIIPTIDNNEIKVDEAYSAFADRDEGAFHLFSIHFWQQTRRLTEYLRVASHDFSYPVRVDINSIWYGLSDYSFIKIENINNTEAEGNKVWYCGGHGTPSCNVGVEMGGKGA